MCIDTIKMRMPITESNIDKIQKLQQRLSDGKTIQFWFRGNEIDCGEIDCSKVTVGTKNLYVKVSLPKVLFGNNIENLNPELTEKTVGMLCNKLKFDISDAVVTKLHIAQTIEVDHQPKMYFEYLGENPRRHRWNCTPDTVYYTTGGKRGWKEFYCYDKVKEASKHIFEDSPYSDKNLLRMELRLERNVALHVSKKYPLIRVKDLADADFQIKLLSLLVAEYNAIHKCRPIVDLKKLSETETPKEIKDHLLVELLQAAETDDISFRERYHTLVSRFARLRTGESFRRIRPMLNSLIERVAVHDRYILEKELTEKVNSLLK